MKFVERIKRFREERQLSQQKSEGGNDERV
jgi:hypothetical protein